MSDQNVGKLRAALRNVALTGVAAATTAPLLTACGGAPQDPACAKAEASTSISAEAARERGGPSAARLQDTIECLVTGTKLREQSTVALSMAVGAQTPEMKHRAFELGQQIVNGLGDDRGDASARAEAALATTLAAQTPEEAATATSLSNMLVTQTQKETGFWIFHWNEQKQPLSPEYSAPVLRALILSNPEQKAQIYERAKALHLEHEKYSDSGTDFLSVMVATAPNPEAVGFIRSRLEERIKNLSAADRGSALSVLADVSDESRKRVIYEQAKRPLTDGWVKGGEKVLPLLGMASAATETGQKDEVFRLAEGATKESWGDINPTLVLVMAMTASSPDQQRQVFDLAQHEALHAHSKGNAQGASQFALAMALTVAPDQSSVSKVAFTGDEAVDRTQYPEYFDPGSALYWSLYNPYNSLNLMNPLSPFYGGVSTSSAVKDSLGWSTNVRPSVPDSAIRGSSARNAAGGAAQSSARNAANSAAQGSARSAAQSSAQSAARGAAQSAARSVTSGGSGVSSSGKK